MMINMMKTFIILLVVSAFFGCGSSKDELVMENETPESLLLKSEQAYNMGKYDESIKLAQLLLDHFPTSDLHIEAQLLISRNYGAKEEYEEQFDQLLRVLKENIIPEKVPSIYAQIGEFYENSARWNPGTVTTDSADYTKAADFYRKAVFYPNSEDETTKAMALYRMALTYAKLKEIETASKAYQEVISTYPSSPYSSLARTKLNDPTNTDELPLPAGMETEYTSTEISPGATPKESTEEATDMTNTLPEPPSEIELPSDDSEEPSILDSLQTIDADSPESDDE
jgi:tetratricopeptide (TPR) repeat protein